MENINRRQNQRIEIKLRCRVSAPAQWFPDAMYTENISRGGILIAWLGESAPLQPPYLGQSVTVEIELPASHGFGPRCIHCEGTVTRVSEPADCPRVGLCVNYMDFRSPRDRVRAFETVRPAMNAWMA
jgi:c-di-GMP-binding flagellar brake protein YcgR